MFNVHTVGTLCRQITEPGHADYEPVLDTTWLESGLLWLVLVEGLHYVPRRGRYLPVAAVDGG